MESYKRSASESIRRALKTFRVVSIVGPRQVGKTTLARLAGEEGPRRAFVSLDDIGALAAARKDPQGFLRGLSRPVTIDEIQRAPDLLLCIKRAVDESPAPGAFLLTGSADPSAIAAVRESLAGRLAMVPLGPLTWSERLRRPGWNPLQRLLDAPDARAVARAFGPSPHPATRLDKEILRGGFPEPALRLAEEARADWHAEYVRTYIERDVPLLVRPDDVPRFISFVRLATAMTAGLLNLARLGRDAGVSNDTAHRWLAVLQSTFVARLLPSFQRSLRKRIVKAPKLHLADTGLAAGVLGIRDWDQAVRMSLAGTLPETWAAQHLQAFAALCRPRAELFHFRTSDGKECDFVVEAAGRRIPIEVKSTHTPAPDDAADLEAFLGLFPREAPFGVLLHPGTDVFPIRDRCIAIPMSAFFGGLPARR